LTSDAIQIDSGEDMRLIIKAVIASAVALASTLASAQEAAYPTKLIKIIVPLAPGGATDTIARIVGQHLSTSLGQPVIVENRPGAGGIIGTDAAAKSPADGYTLFIGNLSTNALNATIYADKLKFKINEALAPVTMLATIPHLLVTSAKLEPTTLKSFVQYAKANPGKLNHASPGVGSYSMLDMLVLEKAAGLDMMHVGYNGGAGQYLGPLMANEVQIAFLNASSVVDHVRTGKLRALGVTTPQRIPELPDVPTMAESGFPDIGTNAWQGLFVPAGTPKPVIAKLHTAIVEIMQRSDVKEQFAKRLITVSTSKTPEEFGTLVNSETIKWNKIVKSLNVKIDS
jgi:tripartite-type tricarboxylate transporter receptor subunit TctC